MIHPHTEIRFINEATGYGVVATKRIPRGTITWVQDELDRIYTQEEAEKLTPLMQQHLETYCFRNAKGQKVLCWDLAKYVNHSFKPTCFSTAYDFEIAVRDIEPGEQLTDDYGYLNLETPFEPVDEGTERKIVYPDDLLHFHQEWDELVKDNIPEIFKQSQPLLQYLPKENWERFSRLRENPDEMLSLKSGYYDPAADVKPDFKVA